MVDRVISIKFNLERISVRDNGLGNLLVSGQVDWAGIQANLTAVTVPRYVAASVVGLKHLSALECSLFKRT